MFLDLAEVGKMILIEIGKISPRLKRSRHGVCGFGKSSQDCGKIFYILPRLLRSRQDCKDLVMTFVAFSNLDN